MGLDQIFTNKPYIAVNREERHYCALFVHALLSSDVARTRFTQLISSKFNIGLDPENLEIYVEAAALRDYWNSLGNSRRYAQQTGNNRRQVLNRIIEYIGCKISVIDDYPFFWTNGIDGRNTKLWSPGHWSEKAIETELTEKSELEKFLQVKRAFNAKPDIMIISHKNAILVEAKLESLEAKYGRSGEDQEKIQKRIACLLKELIPAFKCTEFHNMLLALRSPKDDKWPKSIMWRDVIDIINDPEIDTFTQECFEQLRIRYYANNR